MQKALAYCLFCTHKNTNPMLAQKVQSLAKNILPDLVAIRRHLHQHPELSFEEHQTAAFIRAELHKIGIHEQQFLVNTGTVALLKSAKNWDKKIIALRADIDALPILEANKKSYCSQNQGVMHACGHDAHTTCLLGAARILKALDTEWEGTIKLIFQPAEEKDPGGASLMIAEGVLDAPRPSAIIGLHCDADLEVGKLGVCKGLAMASADEIYLTINGLGGHGARPNQCVDTILLAAQVIQNLQMVVSRNANPLTPSVLTIGKINSEGGATNIIPDRVHIEGTFRTFDEVWREQAHERIRNIVAHTCLAGGGSADIQVLKGYPRVFNAEALTETCQEHLHTYLNKENIVQIPPRMGAEDFGFYTQHVDGFFYRLGTKIPNGTGLHTPTFDIDEAALAIGAGAMAWLGMQIV
jgi:amidohydrolase